MNAGLRQEGRVTNMSYLILGQDQIAGLPIRAPIEKEVPPFANYPQIRWFRDEVGFTLQWNDGAGWKDVPCFLKEVE